MFALRTSFEFPERNPATAAVRQTWASRLAAKAAPTQEDGTAGPSAAPGADAVRVREPQGVSGTDRLDLSPDAWRVVRQIAADPRFAAFLERISSDERVKSLGSPVSDLLDRLAALAAEAKRDAGVGSTGGASTGDAAGGGASGDNTGTGGAGGAAGGGGSAGTAGGAAGGQDGAGGAGGATNGGATNPGGAGRGRAEEVHDQLPDRPRGRSASAPGRRHHEGMAGRADDAQFNQPVGRFGGLVKLDDRSDALGGIDIGRALGLDPGRRASGMATAEMMRSLAPGRAEAPTGQKQQGQESERSRAGEPVATGMRGQAAAVEDLAQAVAAPPDQVSATAADHDVHTTVQEVLRRADGVSAESFEIQQQQRPKQLLDLMV